MNHLVSENMPKSLAGRTTGELLSLYRRRVQLDAASFTDRLNLRLLEADLGSLEINCEKPTTNRGQIRIAIVSLLFNWPSTGGGIVHTAELAKFLSLAGYEVCHFYAVYEPWRVGSVNEFLPYHSEPAMVRQS